ncbi:hypothetical protein [Propioniferax innocua]|uniref:hypothetical protein n=1 Tax=Propioniferax innocua TaxID=1753 RepID=UPI0011532C7B|nr:hypothetical protein [Propioniferax innocua]
MTTPLGPATTGSGQPVDAPWHIALVAALTGERRDDLGLQTEPDMDVVLDMVGDQPLGHHAVPDDLMEQLPAARFAAVLVELRRRRAVGRVPAPGPRSLDADDRRLLADRPPHWG